MTIIFSADNELPLQVHNCTATIVAGEFDIHGPHEEIMSIYRWLKAYPIPDLVLDDNLDQELEPEVSTGRPIHTITLCFASIANDTPINIAFA